MSCKTCAAVRRALLARLAVIRRKRPPARAGLSSDARNKGKQP